MLQFGLSNFATTVRPDHSISYAWDEPIREQIITAIAPGGVSADYDLNQLGEASGLTYENFIYIIFTATFNKYVLRILKNYSSLYICISKISIILHGTFSRRSITIVVCSHLGFSLCRKIFPPLGFLFRLICKIGNIYHLYINELKKN